MSLFAKARNIVTGVSTTPEITDSQLARALELQSVYEGLPGSYSVPEITANAITTASITANDHVIPKTLWIGVTPAENGYLVKVEETKSAYAPKSTYAPQTYKTYVASTFAEVQDIIATAAVTQKLNASS